MIFNEKKIEVNLDDFWNRKLTLTFGTVRQLAKTQNSIISFGYVDS